MCYGLAENTLFVTGNNRYSMKEVIKFDKTELYQEGQVRHAENEEERIEIASCGQGPVNQDIKIIDINTGAILPEGRVGKILLSGASVALGYWNKPEQTDRTFRIKLDDGRNYMDTGDQGFLYQGELFVTGRYKEILIINGVNYTPYPIEQVIEDASQLVKRGGVVALQLNNIDIESITIIVEVASEDKEKLIQLCQKIQENVMREFSIRVREIICTKAKFIPKTTSGKKARYKLQNMLGKDEGILLRYKEKIGLFDEKNIDPKEYFWKHIYSLAQKLHLGKIKRSDQVLTVFNDSLKQMQLISQLELCLNNKDLSISILSQNETFETLIDHLIQWTKKQMEETAQKTDSDSSLEHQQFKSLPVPPMAQMVIHCMGQKEFNLGYVCEVHKNLTFEALQTSLEKLLKIQPYLRSFYSYEQNAFNVYKDCNISCLLEKRTVKLDSSKVKPYIEECIQEISQKINLTRPPLLKLIYLENQQSGLKYLVLVISHLLVDPYSIWLFFDQLGALIDQPEQEKILKQRIDKELFLVKNRLFDISKAADASLKQAMIAKSISDEKASTAFLDAEEELLSLEINQTSYDQLIKYCKNHHVTLDDVVMSLSTQALRKLGKHTTKIQFVHNGRTILHADNPIRYLIGWFNLCWPIVLPNEEPLNWEEYLHEVQKAVRKHESSASAYMMNPTGESDVRNNWFNFLEADLEYSLMGMQQFRTDKGFFITSNLFKDDYLHGSTFAKKLPRYRKLFIRPVIGANGMKILFFLQKGEYPSQELKKQCLSILEEIVS